MQTNCILSALINTSLPWYLTDSPVVCSLCSWLKTKSLTVSMFSSVQAVHTLRLPGSLGVELGAHLVQCGLGRGLPRRQVSSWSIQPFSHNTPSLQTDRHDRQQSDSIGRTLSWEAKIKFPKLTRKGEGTNVISAYIENCEFSNADFGVYQKKK